MVNVVFANVGKIAVYRGNSLQNANSIVDPPARIQDAVALARTRTFLSFRMPWTEAWSLTRSRSQALACSTKGIGE